MSEQKHKNLFGKKLREAILRWNEKMETGENADDEFDALCETVVNACLAGDVWQVPEDVNGRGQVHTTFPMPAQKSGEGAALVTLTAKNAQTLAGLRQLGARVNVDVVLREVPCEEIIRAFAQSKSADRLFLNPHSDFFFFITKELAQGILRHADMARETQEDFEGQKIGIHQKLIITEEQYLADIRAACGEHKWEINSNGINTDGTLTICFQDAEDERQKAALVYSVEGERAQLANFIRFTLPKSFSLEKVMYRKGKFCALLEKNDDEYLIARLIDNGGYRTIGKFSYAIRDCHMLDNGVFVYVLTKEYCDNKKSIGVCLWAKDQGECPLEDGPGVQFCMSFTLTADYEFAWHNSPADHICFQSRESAETCGVSLQSFDKFAFSSDRKALITAFADHGDFSLFLNLRDKNGDYSRHYPIESYSRDPLPAPEDCEHFGCPKMLLNLLVLLIGKDFYVYDLDSCVTRTVKEKEEKEK